MNKLGTPADRSTAADLARSIRAMWPTLKGEWTRRDWNQRALSAAHNYISHAIRFRRANHG